MKKTILNRCLLPALAALALVATTSQTQAQFPQGSYTNNFATGGNTTPFSGSGSVASWIYWYNTPGGNSAVTNDVTTPDTLAGGDAGSLEIYCPFSAENGFGSTNHTQNLFFGTFGNGGGYDFSQEVNLLNFDTVSFDVFVNATNPVNQVTGPDANGNWGTLNVGVITAGYGYEGFSAGAVTIPGVASNGWVRLTVPIDHTLGGITTIPGICFDYNSYGGYPTNTLVFWVGNVVMHYNGLPPPAPTVALTKITTTGLDQLANAKPSYNRQSIATDSTGTANLTWYGQPKPVTYSWTIASFPSAANSNFLSALTITPDPVANQTYPDADWSANTCFWIAMQNNADGTSTIGAAWKTNEVDGNAQLFSATQGQLIAFNNETNGLTVPSAVGTWKLTFTSDTDFTLTAPNGAVTNASIPADVAALYSGYVGVYLYSSPQVDANVGQACTYSGYKISGVGTPVNENLTSGALSSPFLRLMSQGYSNGSDTNPPNQVFVTTNDAYWFSWTLPAFGYSPVTSATLSSPAWNDIGGSFVINGATDLLLVPKANLPASGQGFFAMIQRQFTQLQVLLPGETNAPGTATGKIGTPTPQSLSGSGTDVIVNAVDSTWHIISGPTDLIKLTCSDGTASLPNNLAMVNGTATFTGANNLLWGSQGTFTVTATDIASGTTIPPATSSSVVVGP